MARAGVGGVGGGGVRARGPNPAGWVWGCGVSRPETLKLSINNLIIFSIISTCNINIQRFCFARKFFLKSDKLMLFLRKNQVKRTKPRQIMGTIRKKVMLIYLYLTLKVIILLDN
jgi:hypothetical protein